MDTHIQYIAFGSAAIVTNCFVIFVLLKNPNTFRKSAFVFGLSVGDIIDGVALVSLGTLRIMLYKDGTNGDRVHPRYCMVIFMTPVFLLGNQIPGFMFFLVGIERLLAVGRFDWYYARWSNKLAWTMTAAVYGCCTVSLGIAYGVVFSFDDNVTVTVSCGTSGVIGSGYSVYNYGISIVGGAVAVVATVIAMVSFSQRKRRMTAAMSNSIKTHVKKEWLVTRVMLCLAVLDVGLVVVPNLFATFSSGFRIPAFSGFLAWSLQIVSLRSSLNVFIYFFVNSEFRQATLRAFGLKKRTVSVAPNVLENGGSVLPFEMSK